MTKTMKWVFITMLLLAILQLPVARHQVLLSIVVCTSGLLVVAQAVRAGKYPWAIGFLAIAVLFNPVVSIARSGSDFSG
jgi:Family of unknown function (DUF6804)